METPTLLQSLISDSQSLLTGLISGATSIINFLITNELTRLFLAVAVLGLIVGFVSHFVHAKKSIGR